jgi:hypothetical protein
MVQQGGVVAASGQVSLDGSDWGGVEKRWKGQIGMCIVAVNGPGNMKPECPKTVLELSVIEAEDLLELSGIGVFIEYENVDVASGSLRPVSGRPWARELSDETACGDRRPRAPPINPNTGTQVEH